MNASSRRMPWLMSLFVRGAGGPQSATSAQAPAVTEAESSDTVVLAARRAEALRQLFPKLYSWYANRSEWSAAIDVHNYLAQATNLSDLENRIRVIERRHHFRA